MFAKSFAVSVTPSIFAAYEDAASVRIYKTHFVFVLS